MCGFDKNTNLETILTQKMSINAIGTTLPRLKINSKGLKRHLKLSYWILKILGITIKLNKNFESKKEIPHSTKFWWAKTLANLVDC